MGKEIMFREGLAALLPVMGEEGAWPDRCQAREALLVARAERAESERDALFLALEATDPNHPLITKDTPTR